MFINVGFNNLVAGDRIVALIGFDSAPAKRLVQDAKDDGRAVDCTCGRRTRSVIIMDSEHVIMSAVQTETLAARLAEDDAVFDDTDEE